MPIKRLLWLGAGLLLLFLVLGFPAAAIWRWNAASAPGLELTGVSGTVWRGRADQVRWQLAPLGELSWHWQAGWPLRWEITVQGPLLNLRGLVYNSGDALRVNDVSARWSAWLMQSPIPGATLDGQFFAKLDELLWLGQQPQRISGQLQWRDARLVSPIAIDLGQINIDIQTLAEGRIGLKLNTSAGGEIQVRGQGEVSAGRYQLTLYLRSHSAQANVGQWLRQVGELTEDGSVRVKLSGALQHGGQS